MRAKPVLHGSGICATGERDIARWLCQHRSAEELSTTIHAMLLSVQTNLPLLEFDLGACHSESFVWFVDNPDAANHSTWLLSSDPHTKWPGSKWHLCRTYAVTAHHEPNGHHQTHIKSVNDSSDAKQCPIS